MAAPTRRTKAAKPKTPAKRGRPSTYRAIYAEQVQAFCLLGADDKKLAELFEISEATLNTWKKRHPAFRQAIKNGKDIPDAVVASALYKSAIGGHVISEDRAVSDGKGGTVVVTLKKQLAPEVQAQGFWLKNRQPKLWKDKIELKEEINLNVFPPREVLQELYDASLKRSTEKAAILAGRRERLGIIIDQQDQDGD